MLHAGQRSDQQTSDLPKTPSELRQAWMLERGSDGRLFPGWGRRQMYLSYNNGPFAVARQAQEGALAIDGKYMRDFSCDEDRFRVCSGKPPRSPANAFRQPNSGSKLSIGPPSPNSPGQPPPTYGTLSGCIG